MSRLAGSAGLVALVAVGLGTPLAEAQSTAPPSAAGRQEKGAEQDRVRRFGPIPNRPRFRVMEYLQQVMNDPNSLEGVECLEKVYYVERGWLLGCNYRGRNGFGGMVKEANWFVIRQGRVIEMLPFSAYSP